MLSYFVKVAVLATLAAAQCDPTPPTTTAGPGPTGGSGTTTVIHPNGNNGKCVDVDGANFSNGSKIQMYDCNGTAAQKFTLSRGDGQVKVAGKNFCLDAGENPHDGSLVKIWQCIPGVKQQQWYYTNDNRIALTNQGLCLDLPSGNLNNFQQLQVWSCATGNTNQVWTSSVKTSARRRRQLDLTPIQDSAPRFDIGLE